MRMKNLTEATEVTTAAWRTAAAKIIKDLAGKDIKKYMSFTLNPRKTPDVLIRFNMSKMVNEFNRQIQAALKCDEDVNWEVEDDDDINVFIDGYGQVVD